MKTICNKTSPLNWIKLVFMVNWVSIVMTRIENCFKKKFTILQNFKKKLILVIGVHTIYKEGGTLLIIQERGY